MEMKSQKPYHTDYSLLIMQDLWRAHNRILLINLPKKFIKLGMMIKNVKHVELNMKIASAVLNTQTLKMILWNTDVNVVITIIKKSLKKRFSNTYKFPNHGINTFILLLKISVPI